MYLNLVGEEVYEVSDLVDQVLKSEDFKKRYRLMIKPGTKMGFYLHSNFSEAPTLSKRTGIYAIYHGKNVFYVGATRDSIHKRVGRFLKEVLRNSRPTEGHSSAKKFRGLYDTEELDNLYISALELTIPLYIDLANVEKYVIHALNPYSNRANR